MSWRTSTDRQALHGSPRVTRSTRRIQRGAKHEGAERDALHTCGVEMRRRTAGTIRRTSTSAPPCRGGVLRYTRTLGAPRPPCPACTASASVRDALDVLGRHWAAL